MFMSADDIRYFVLTEDMISPPEGMSRDAWKKRCDHIEGGAFDLTVENIFCPAADEAPIIGREQRSIPTPLEWELEEPGVWVLSRGVYLARTAETIKLPPCVTGVVDSRTSMFRSGAVVATGPIHPGYCGKLVVGLLVNHVLGLVLEPGARIITVRFGYLSKGATDTYRGIWGGDRVTTDGRVERGY